MGWVYFGIGLFIGGGVGMFAIALMVAAKRGDQMMGVSENDETN